MIGVCKSIPVRELDNRTRGDAKIISSQDNLIALRWAIDGGSRNYREATQLEIEWVNQSILARKKSKKPTIKNYELW